MTRFEAFDDDHDATAVGTGIGQRGLIQALVIRNLSVLGIGWRPRGHPAPPCGSVRWPTSP